jgi:Zn-dependent oligopeptidase
MIHGYTMRGASRAETASGFRENFMKIGGSSNLSDNKKAFRENSRNAFETKNICWGWIYTEIQPRELARGESFIR